MSAYKKLMLSGKSIAESTDEAEKTAVENQVEKFSTDYSNEKFNELCNEFESITLDNSDTVTQVNAKSYEKVSARAKLLLVTAMLVFSLVLTLFIYNFVVINTMQNSINILQGDAIYQEQQAVARETQLDELLDEQVIEGELADLGYNQIASENVTRVAVGGGATAKVQTNWFDTFCGFIRSIFGG